MRPNRLFFAGLFLVLAGVVLPFLMVIGVLPSSLWLSFVSYFSSVAGLFLGVLSVAAMVGNRKRRHEQDR